MIVNKPPTAPSTYAPGFFADCLPLFSFDLLGEKSDRHLAAAQVRTAAKVYRLVESLFFVRAMHRLMSYKYIWGSWFRSELSFSSASRQNGTWNPRAIDHEAPSGIKRDFPLLFYYRRSCSIQFAANLYFGRTEGWRTRRADFSEFVHRSWTDDCDRL